MRITIDYTPAYEQGGGIGRYVRQLVAALATHDTNTDYNLFIAGAGQLPASLAPNFTWQPTRISPLWLARFWHRLKLPFPVEIFTGRTQLYHATDFVLPPTLRQTRTLLTVHDLSFVRVPEAASPRLKAYLDAVVPRSTRNADHILADSQATKDDLIALYDLPPEKITVLLSGVEDRFKRVEHTFAIRQKYNIPDRPYIFSIGTVQPRKNYERLIQALARLRSSGHDVGLVIAGGKGWLDAPIYAMIEQSQMADYVHFIGFADDVDLPALYSAAACVSFATLYEGFGFPVLEGMACGTPVLTSNVSSLPEVAGDAALMVDPYNVEAITDALRRLLDDTQLRETLIGRGYIQAAKFTWESSAKHLIQIYQQMLL